MKIAFQLHRRTEPLETAGVFLPVWDAGAVLDLCASLNLAPKGRVFATTEGFLLKFEERSTRVSPGCLRLRTVAPNLYIPVDADLIPSLLDDEAQGLGRDTGYIFLPWNQVVRFDPHSPVDPSRLLETRVLRRGDWKAFPNPPTLACRIVEIDVQLPLAADPTLVDEQTFNERIDNLLPNSGPIGSTIAGEVSFRAGRAMIRLGNALNWKRLAQVGARWVNSGLQGSPRLNEIILGRQSSALRNLLREFREGNRERALSHALPLADPAGSRGGRPTTSDRLPHHRLFYSLNALLGSNQRGPSSYWQTDDTVMAELRCEYQKAASEAIRAGDFRRAAYIYGTLLHDYRAAARALTLDGLHRDAAIVLLQKLQDLKGAAAAFEAAGDLDRAIPLYRQIGEHESVGDLLRRLDDEEAAQIAYRLAANRLISTGADYLAAGQLMLKKARDAEMALKFFETGWSRRPSTNDMGCVQAAITLRAEAGMGPLLDGLLDEVDLHLGHAGKTQQCAQYYNFLMHLSEREELVSIRSDLRDRALIGLATKLRQNVQPGGHPGSLVSEFFGQSSAWPAPLIGDADFATKAASQRPRTSPSKNKDLDRIPIHDGRVTAVCSVPETDEVFVGFDDGCLFCFRPRDSAVVRVSGSDLPVSAVSVHPDGESLVVLRAGKSGLGVLNSYTKTAESRYPLVFGMSVDGATTRWLTPILPQDGESLVGLWDGSELMFLTVTGLLSVGSRRLWHADDAPVTALLLQGGERTPDCSVFYHNGREWILAREGEELIRTGMTWRPASHESEAPSITPVSWSHDNPELLEVAALGPYGTIHWASLQVGFGLLDLLASNTTGSEGGYRTTTIARPGLVAGVTNSAIHWLRCGASTFSRSSIREADLDSIVACASSRGTSELLVISQEGWLARLPFPHTR